MNELSIFLICGIHFDYITIVILQIRCWSILYSLILTLLHNERTGNTRPNFSSSSSLVSDITL